MMTPPVVPARIPVPAPVTRLTPAAVRAKNRKIIIKTTKETTRKKTSKGVKMNEIEIRGVLKWHTIVWQVAQTINKIEIIIIIEIPGTITTMKTIGDITKMILPHPLILHQARMNMVKFKTLKTNMTITKTHLLLPVPALAPVPATVTAAAAVPAFLGRVVRRKTGKKDPT